MSLTAQPAHQFLPDDVAITDQAPASAPTAARPAQRDLSFLRHAHSDMVPGRRILRAGGAAARNSMHSDWWTKSDVKIEQELPGFGDDHHFLAFFIIENFGNLLNDEWGVLREASFPRYQPIVGFDVDSVTGQYVYEDFFQPDGQSRATDASLWELRFGVRYEF